MSVTETSIRHFAANCNNHEVAAITALWNRSLRDNYGFFPLSENVFQTQIIDSPRFQPERLLLAQVGNELIGAVHWEVIDELHYPSAGVVAGLWVAPEERGRGVGGALLAVALRELRKLNLLKIIAPGVWPYASFYSTLIDGSERSGVACDNAAFLRIFARENFQQAENSFILALDLQRDLQPLAKGEQVRLRSLRGEIATRTYHRAWLDFVFRGWTLRDHRLIDENGQLLSRAMAARMPGVSEHTQRETYAVFGVNTPVKQRRRGWARINLHTALSQLRTQGVERAELHVYTHNTAAVGLYKGLGFREVGRTVKLVHTS